MISLTTGYICVFILVNDASKSHNKALVHGFGHALNMFGRAVAPIGIGVLFYVETKTFPYNYFLPFFVIGVSTIFTAMIAIMGDILKQQYNKLEIPGHTRYDNTKVQGLISSNNINRKSHVYGRLNDDINSHITGYSRDSRGNSVFGGGSRSRGASANPQGQNQDKYQHQQIKNKKYNNPKGFQVHPKNSRRNNDRKHKNKKKHRQHERHQQQQQQAEAKQQWEGQLHGYLKDNELKTPILIHKPLSEQFENLVFEQMVVCFCITIKLHTQKTMQKNKQTKKQGKYLPVLHCDVQTIIETAFNQ